MRELFQISFVVASVLFLVSLVPGRLVAFRSVPVQVAAKPVFAFVTPSENAYAAMTRCTRMTWQMNARLGLVGMPMLGNDLPEPDERVANHALQRPVFEELFETVGYGVPSADLLMPPSLAAEESILPPIVSTPASKATAFDADLKDMTLYESLTERKD